MSVFVYLFCFSSRIIDNRRIDYASTVWGLCSVFVLPAEENILLSGIEYKKSSSNSLVTFIFLRQRNQLTAYEQSLVVTRLAELR